MVDSRLTYLSMENHHHLHHNSHPSTHLSMDSSTPSLELDFESNRKIMLSGPPDINLPLPAPCEILDAGLGPQIYEPESFLSIPKVARKCAKRIGSIWGAWFFFSFYFKPVLNEKSKAKIIQDSSGVFSGFDKSDLKLDIFMVQHDMENMYMWVFKDRPENTLGKMQLRSFMNGHSRQGERPFPFCVDKGFIRSHRMQRKHYRGLSNPQCVHGIEVFSSPNLTGLDDVDKKRWVELTGRDLNFIIPSEASDFGSWRNLPSTDFELERPLPLMVKNSSNSSLSKKFGSDLDLSGSDCNGIEFSPSITCKRKKGSFSPDDWFSIQGVERNWLNDFSGVMKNVYGPAVGAKTIYEDEEGYLIIMSLPFVDLQRVKVSWRNTPTHCIIKVSCVSAFRMPFIKRRDRIFKLTDPSSEHCPPGEFVREIPLSTQIPEDAKIEAYFDGPGSVLEIMVPKLAVGPEEHEVQVCFRSHLGGNDLLSS